MAHKVGTEDSDPGAGFHSGWARLMADVLIFSYRDLMYGCPSEQLDAAGFLLTDGPLYADALGLDYHPLHDIFTVDKKRLRRCVGRWKRL